MPSRPSSNSNELISLMFMMGRFMREKMQKKAPGGIYGSLLHFEALRYVHDKGKPLMSDVARHFHITPPAATLLIETLAKEHLLARVLDPKDRRAVRIAITPKGKNALVRGKKQRIAELKKIFAVLTDKEKKQFAALLKKIIKNGA